MDPFEFVGLEGIAWHIIFRYADYECSKDLLRLVKHSIPVVNLYYPLYMLLLE